MRTLARTFARKGALVMALLCSAALVACSDLERHFMAPALVSPPPQQAARVAPRRPVVKRVVLVRPRVITAGARIRGFCTQRHVRFQAGALRETDAEKARNDVLCRQEAR